MNIRIDLNEPGIIERVTNDNFGLLVSQSWKKILDPYTPKDTGIMQGSVKLRPWEIEYFQPYSAYQYFGIMWIDPVYHCSGFMTDEGWKSRFGVKKVPSGRNLKYQKNNPYSTDHWDIKAAEAGKLEDLYITLNDALDSGKY